MRFVLIFLLIFCFGCTEKNTQSVILTPKNDSLIKKMKEIGCECLYTDVKNKFLYNKNTGLYFISLGAEVMYKEAYKACFDKLSLSDVKQLYGKPHLEDDINMYYYGNVSYCGQWFEGLRFEKKQDNDKVVNIKTHVQEFPFPKDSTINWRCRSVDFLDAHKMRVNQDFFEYFTEDFVDTYFEVAKYVRIQPKFENAQASSRCLENIQFEQNNFLYNMNMKCYMKNWSSNDRAFPLMGHDDEEHKNCTSFLSSSELIIKAYGEPSYISKNKDTISYITGNTLYKGKVINESYIFYDNYNTYGKGSVPLDTKYLPKTLEQNCTIVP